MQALLRFCGVVALVAGLAGCGTARIVMAPDGQPAYYVRCRNPYNCEARAQRICYQGYQVVSGGPHYWLIRCPEYQDQDQYQYQY